MLYQDGRYQGDPVTLGVGGFGRVELVSVFLCFTIGYLMESEGHYPKPQPCFWLKYMTPIREMSKVGQEVLNGLYNISFYRETRHFLVLFIFSTDLPM